MNTLKPLPVSADEIRALAERVPTPFHLYDEAGMLANVRHLQAAFSWHPDFKEYFAVNNDPRKAASFVGDRRRRIRNAADLAMKEIHEKIHKRLDAMIGSMAASGRDVRMVFDNYSEAYAETFEAIRAAVDSLPGCNNASATINASARTAEIAFRCQMDMDSLRRIADEAIRSAVPGAAMRPDTVSSDANTWNLSW